MNASFSDSINASVTNDLQVDGQIDTFDLVSDTGSITTFDSTTSNVSTLNVSILNNDQGNFSIVNASDITYIGDGATAGTIDWKGFGNKIETYLFNGSVMNTSKLDAINGSMTGVLDVDTINASTINGDNLSTASMLFNSDFQFSLNTLSLAPGQTSSAIQTATLNTIATQVDSATGNFSTINSDFATIGGTLNSNSINVSTLNYSSANVQNISASNISLTGSLTVNPGSGFGTPVKIGRTTIGNTSFDNMLSLGVDNNTTGSNYNFSAVANNQTIMNIANSTTHNSFRAENVEVMRNSSVGLGIKTLSDPTNALEVNGTINTSNISSINGSFTNITATSITAPDVQPLIGDGDLTIARTSGLQTALDSKQETLTAGTNITIVGTTISATTFDPTNISNTNLSSVNITATSFNATNITGNVSGGNVNCDVLMVSQNGEGIINGYDPNHAIHIRLSLIHI